MSRYDWLLTGRAILLEGYIPPMFPKLEYDPEYAAELIKKMGYNIFRFPALSYYAHYPTPYFPNHPELKGRDLLKETIEACHRRGIKVIPYIPVGHPFLPVDSDLKPYDSWAKLDEKGNRMGWWHLGLFESYFLCLNTPYRQAIKKIVEEIVTGYEVDGIYFDGPYQDQTMNGSFCHCPYCKEAYYKKTGKSIPKNGIKRNWNDPELREYLAWILNDVKRGLMRELNGIIKRKDIPHLFNNCGWLSGKYWGGERYRDLDGFMFEGVHTSQEKLLHIMLGRSTGKYIWSYIGSYAATGHPHHVMTIPGVADYPGIPACGDELRNEGFTVLAGNGAVIYYGLNRIYYQGKSAEERLMDINDFIIRNEEMLKTARNQKFIGLWVSASTRDWWYKNDDYKNSKYRNFYYGAFNVLKDLYHQVEPFYMSEESRVDISPYRLVFLPNVACMSDEEMELVREYVKNGGNVIASYMTSLFDEAGNRREDFGLSDLFGISFTEKEVKMRRDAYIRITKEHPIVQGFEPGRLIPQDLQFLTVEAENRDDVVGVTTGIGHDVDSSPAVIARNYGKGKVVYLTGGLEALYRAARFQELSALFDNMIHWMVGEQIPYTLEGPKGLVVNMVEGRDFSLLHIVNNNGNILNHAPTRQDYVPVYNVKVQVAVAGRPVKRVRLLHGNQEPAYTVKNGKVETVIPKIHYYECLAVEYEGQ